MFDPNLVQNDFLYQYRDTEGVYKHTNIYKDKDANNKVGVLTAEGEAVGAVGEALVGAAGGALDVAGGAVVGGAGDLVVALVVPFGDDGGVLAAVGRRQLGVPRPGRLGRLLGPSIQEHLGRGRVPRRRQRQRHHQHGDDGAAKGRH